MIYDNVTFFLKEAGLNQNDLAEKLNVSRQQIYRYLHEKPSLTSITKIAAVLNVEPWQLLKPLEENETITPRQEHPEPEPPQTICPYCGKPLKITIQ